MERLIPRVFGPRHSLRRAIWIILAIGVFSFGITALPSVFDRGHLVADIVHGGAFQVALVCSVPMLLAIVGIGFTIRHPTSRLNSRIGAYPYSFIVMMSMMLPFIVPQIETHMEASALIVRGVPVQARLVREFDTECGKTGCTVDLEYRFMPPGGLHPVSGYARVGSSRRDPDTAYTYAIDTNSVPILYDPADPTRSMLYWKDRIARQATWGYTLGLIGIFLGICTVVWTFFVVIIEVGVRQQRRKRVADTTARETHV